MPVVRFALDWQACPTWAARLDQQPVALDGGLRGLPLTSVPMQVGIQRRGIEAQPLRIAEQ
jgi:hypothetical protein